jgi:predicted transposase YbfD/YdcC
VLAQVKTDEKSNEITAIPVLLDRLDLQGQIVTLDAMGCQRAICEQIIDKGGDYVISLKGNQGTLNNNVRLWFEDEKNLLTQSWEEWSKGHGRIEHRFCETTDDIGWLQEIHKWPGLKSIAVVHSTRETKKGIEKESRYYISSLSANAEQIARAARSHWGIENSLHWVLDVTMNEDRIQIHNENAPEILSIMRKWGINIINKNKGKYSIKRMIQKMAMSPKNLFKMLLNF